MFNKAIICGNLGQNPSLRYSASGTAVCNLNVASNENFRDKDGNAQKRTSWHKVVVFGKPAEACAQYLVKGRQVLVEGKLRTQKWTDKDNNVRYTTEIVADNVQFLGTKPTATAANEDISVSDDAKEIFGEEEMPSQAELSISDAPF